jgi:hypothetical protein
METSKTPWALVGEDPSKFFHPDCIPVGFKFQDPSRMGASNVKQLLMHLRARQKILGVNAFHFHHVMKDKDLMEASYPETAKTAIAAGADIIERLAEPDRAVNNSLAQPEKGCIGTARAKHLATDTTVELFTVDAMNTENEQNRHAPSIVEQSIAPDEYFEDHKSSISSTKEAVASRQKPSPAKEQRPFPATLFEARPISKPPIEAKPLVAPPFQARPMHLAPMSWIPNQPQVQEGMNHSPYMPWNMMGGPQMLHSSRPNDQGNGPGQYPHFYPPPFMQWDNQAYNMYMMKGQAQHPVGLPKPLDGLTPPIQTESHNLPPGQPPFSTIRTKVESTGGYIFPLEEAIPPPAPPYSRPIGANIASIQQPTWSPSTASPSKSSPVKSTPVKRKRIDEDFTTPTRSGRTRRPTQKLLDSQQKDK